MIHWTTCILFCFLGGFVGFMIAALLGMAHEDTDALKEAGKDKFETIEIDRVEWDSDGEVVFPRGGYMAWKGLVGRPPMKMILLTPKEDHER